MQSVKVGNWQNSPFLLFTTKKLVLFPLKVLFTRRNSFSFFSPSTVVQIKHSAQKEVLFFFFFFLTSGLCRHIWDLHKNFFFPLDFFFLYEVPCVILGSTQAEEWWNRFLGVSSPSIGNLQSVRQCGRNVIWSAGAAAAVSPAAAAAAATHDGFPGGAVAPSYIWNIK